VAPADECLDTRETIRVQIDLGLVDEGELLGAQRPAQIGREF